MFNEAGIAKYNDLPVSTMQTVKQLANPKFMGILLLNMLMIR